MISDLKNGNDDVHLGGDIETLQRCERLENFVRRGASEANITLELYNNQAEWRPLIGPGPSRYCVLIGWDRVVATSALLCHKDTAQGT